MKVWMILTTAIAVAAAADGQTQTSGTGKDALVAILDAMADANTRGDAEGRARLRAAHMTDEFSCITTDGKLVGKDARQKPGTVVQRPSDRRITIYDDTAVVTGIVDATSVDRSGAARNIHFRYMQVWVTQDRTWKLAACAGTPIAPEPAKAPSDNQ